MNAKNVKKEIVTCTKCKWGALKKDSQYEGAIERARIRLMKETGFGIKEKNETS